MLLAFSLDGLVRFYLSRLGAGGLAVSPVLVPCHGLSGVAGLGCFGVSSA
jgi:hypothetical protein